MQQISQQLGVDQATAEQAVQSALPAMLAGMSGNAQQADASTTPQPLLGGGAQGALGGGVLGGLGSILAGGAQGGDLGGMLGSILGGNKDVVQNDVQQKSGLDSAKTKQLLMLLAPIVLAALAKRQSQGQKSAPQADAKPNDMNRKDPNADNGGGLLGKILAQVQEPRR
jgi:hypothetical protein